MNYQYKRIVGKENILEINCQAQHVALSQILAKSSSSYNVQIWLIYELLQTEK